MGAYMYVICHECEPSPVIAAVPWEGAAAPDRVARLLREHEQERPGHDPYSVDERAWRAR